MPTSYNTPLPATSAIVYIVYQTDPPYVKIGWTQQAPGQRLTELQVGNPAILKFYHYRSVPTPEAALYIEKKLHRRYAECRIRGEWFRILPSPALQLELDDMADDANEYFDLFDKFRQREDALQQHDRFADWQREWRSRLQFEIVAVNEARKDTP